MRVEEIHFIDYGAQGEYGLLGKVVAVSEVRGMSEAERKAEVEAVRAIVGEHVVAIELEVIPAIC